MGEIGSRIGVVVFLGGLLATQAQAMEGMVMSGSSNNTCPLMAGMHEMHLSAYHPSTGVLEELCMDIPATGPLTIAIDAVSPEIRDMTSEFRVVRDNGLDNVANADLASVTLAHLPPKAYPSGVATFTVDLDKPGKYALLVTLRDGKTMEMSGTHVMTVGSVLQKWLFVPVAAGLALTAVLIAYFRAERRKSAPAKG